MADSQSSLLSTVREAPEPSEIVVFKGIEYHVVERSANARRVNRISWIWGHGREVRCFAESESKKHFQCGVCGQIFPVWSTTHHASIHLNDKHGIHEHGGQSTSPMQADSPSVIEQLCRRGQQARALVTEVTVAKFRYLLLRWICCMHICLSIVQDDTFRDLIQYICLALSRFLVKSANTIRDWIMKEFKRQKIEIRRQIRQARSQVHISFDCWTSGNSLLFVAIVAHFLDANLVNQSVLIALKRLRYSHSAENIAQVIIPVLKEMLDPEQLGHFIADNENTNDAVIRLILAELRPTVLPQSYRVRCLGHIINLAAKAHSVQNDIDCFEDDFESQSPQELWEHRRDFDRKIHTLVGFIRFNSQRREKFEACCIGAQMEDEKFKSKF
jgi:hypothetical protein